VWTSGVYIKGTPIALLPLLVSRPGLTWYCTAYSRIGQHGDADYDFVISHTRPATYEEYEPLARELEQIGYKLDIRKRAPHWRVVADARDQYLEMRDA
jgi:hypothetical protein